MNTWTQSASDPCGCFVGGENTCDISPRHALIDPENQEGAFVGIKLLAQAMKLLREVQGQNQSMNAAS